MADINIPLDKKPKNIEEFKAWMKGKFGFNPVSCKLVYDSSILLAKGKFEQSLFWKAINSDWHNIADKYKIRFRCDLFQGEVPQLYIKSLDSIINKAYRKDILKNKNFPEAPEGGWITPDNWYFRINDFIRTTIVVKYLDGVEFVENELKRIAQENECGFDSELEAKDEGYYADHTGIKIELPVLNTKNIMVKDVMNVEIQITV